MEEYVALLKIGKLEHLHALREEGFLYCKPLKYFSELEDNIHRGDELEGVTAIMNLDGAKLRMKDVDAPDSEYSNPMMVSTGKMLHKADHAKGNIFCLYSMCVTKDALGKNHVITDDAKAFGDHFLIIKNYREFLKRIEAKIAELGMKGNFGFINYKDFAGYTGKKSHFEKDLLFKDQQEFRIFINNEAEEVLNLQIGSLADISEIGCCIDLEAINFYDIDDKVFEENWQKPINGLI